ncbi:Fungalysin metallopeptidase-domain-containing protein [Globomyces pollinis-pini]|nr:Fungalysin metallopeptidase-domain-containing protein [Globomyces pollinis-pini]
MLVNTIAALTLALASHAIPTQSTTHQVEYVKRNGVSLPFYYPEVSSKSYPVNESKSFAPTSDTEIAQIATDSLAKEFQLNSSEVTITQKHTDKAGVTHVYAVRTIGGVPVDNQNMSVHIKNGNVVSISSSVVGGKSKRGEQAVPSKEVIVSLADAVKVANKGLGLPRDDFPAKMVYVQLPTGKLVYAHQFQVKAADASKWYQVSVSADTGELVQVVDYVNFASYKVLQLPNNDPRDGFTVATDPANLKASPKGWNEDATTKYTNTQGNNVDSRVGSSTRFEGGESLNFDTKFDETSAPTVEANQRTATVNSFYLSNMVHDITYGFGFDEKSGNFQKDNFGLGGKGGDRVIVNNQASGTNNANFATPPDGQSGVMNMFRFTITTPNRDGSLENGIPIHEYVHGVSNRLTGGSAQGNCLQTTQAGGMGEGWSDTVAMFIERKATDTRETDFVTGSYVLNKPSGVRKQPYSTSLTRNTYTYNSLKQLTEVHAIGEVWATILNEVYWNLVDKLGFSPNWFDPAQPQGNIVAMQIVIGGLKLQPCNPTLIAARDAILKADETYYNGANKCEIWRGFAKRGLGVDATSKFVNGNKVPEGC